MTVIADHGQSPQVALRLLRWWDLPAVVALEAAAFPNDAWSARTFWAELARDTRWYVTAVTPEGQIVGYAGLRAVDDTGDVQTLAVASGATGAGIGRRLLDALLLEARRRSCREVLLEVRSDNAVARRLYERAGFDRIGIRRGYYERGTVDAVVLRYRSAGKSGGE
jgi:[ribosomal protein S18]-alanine N-acetyltransferase